jgi:hypothetical protein
MLRIEIVIPTRDRLEKLIKCLGSIEEAKKQIEEHNLFVYVYSSSEKEYRKIDYLVKGYRWILTRFLKEEYNASTFWNRHLKEFRGDVFYYINDDTVLAPDCLKNSIESMNSHFPDLDGVIGINQENIPINQQCKSAFGAIGSEFVERFPDRQVFMPKYKRFYLDTELYEYSSKINKFYFDETAKLLHMHPAFNSKWMDETHTNVRKHLSKDKKLYEERQREHLLWGDTFKC